MPRAASTRVLWVTEEPPDRSLGGGSIRQAYLFEALARAIPTDLLLVGDLKDRRVRDAAGQVTLLPRRVAPWSQNVVARRAIELAIMAGSRYPSSIYPASLSRRSLFRALRDRAASYDVVCIEHESLVPLWRAVPGVPSVVTFHHLVSEMIGQELAQTSGARQAWYRKRDLAKARSLEREALRSYQRVVACSGTDAATLRALGAGAGADVAVIPNGVDLAAFRVTEVPQEPRVLFPGSLAYGPNVDGAIWFVRQVWPRVLAACPDAELRLAGREPVVEVSALAANPGVSVCPNVPSMEEQFGWAKAVVVPLRVGTGTRLKALEAMAASRPLVGTSIGLDGIGVTDGVHARVADDPIGMAQALVEVLGDQTLAASLARTARQHVEDRFGWDGIGDALVELVRGLLPDGSSVPPVRQ